MTHGRQELDSRTGGTEEFSAELEKRRAVLSQIEELIKSATSREQILEQLRRISEETKFVHQLSGFSSSLQTAASILGLIRENSRLYNLATRRLTELDQKSASSFRSTAASRQSPSPPTS